MYVYEEHWTNESFKNITRQLAVSLFGNTQVEKMRNTYEILMRRQDPNNYSDTETRALSIHDPTSAAQAVSHALRNPKIKVQSNLLSTQLV